MQLYANWPDPVLGVDESTNGQAVHDLNLGPGLLARQLFDQFSLFQDVDVGCFIDGLVLKTMLIYCLSD